jgi:type II secretory pathway pseudopilin PulG
MRKYKINNAKGDTIVEVLIAIAVVSSVLAISYSTMNRNILVGRDNQERTEASKLALGQIEALKNIAEFDETELNTDRVTPFCIDVNNANLTSDNVIPNSAFRSDFSDVFANYPPACTSSGRYFLAIQYDSANEIYRAYVRWEGLITDKNESVIVYGY